MARLQFSVFSLVICLLMVFTVTSTSGLMTDEAQLLQDVRQVAAPYWEMRRTTGRNMTERIRILEAVLENVEAEITAQNLTQKYDQIMHKATAESKNGTLTRSSKVQFTFSQTACVACGFSLGIIVAACIDCATIS